MVKTIQQLRAQMQEQAAKTAEGSISPNDVFGLMQDALDTLANNGEYPRADVSQMTINKAPILALDDPQDALGWAAYTTGNNDIQFAAELPNGATYLGAIFEITGSGSAMKIKVFAGEDIHDCGYSHSWAGFYYDKEEDTTVYLSAQGSYDADCNRLSTETEGVAGAAFTIKRCDNSDYIYLPENDTDFQANFGTATNEQRQLAMLKLGGFFAAQKCDDFNPAAALLNMHGMWRMPSMYELQKARENALLTSCKYGKQFDSYEGHWSLLEDTEDDAWYYYLESVSSDLNGKSNVRSLRAVCVL